MHKTLSEQAQDGFGGKSKNGDFVLQTQKTHEAFSHVNKSWLSKCQTFEETLKQGRKFQERFEDRDGLRLRDIASHQAIFSASDSRFKATPHALRQLSAKLGLPARYLEHLSKVDEKLFDLNFNRAVERAVRDFEAYKEEVSEARKNNEEKPERPEYIDREVFLRFKKEGENLVLRAALSSRYAVINNLPIIETLGDIVPGGRLSHLNFNGDTLRANILIPDSLREESDSDYGGGISVLNNETGQFPLRVRPFVFRAICFNGNIWGGKQGTELNRRHIGTVSWRDLRKVLVNHIQTQLPLVQENIDKVLSLKGTPVTQQEIEKAIVYLGKREALSKDVVRSWHTGFKEELANAKTANDILSAFGVVQGLTRAAQVHGFEIQETLETLSARLIESNWDKLLTTARNAVDEEKVQKVLG